MISAFAPAEPGVIRDVILPTLVTVRDPSGEDPFFRSPRVATQMRVRELGGRPISHVVRLQCGTDRVFDPSWVTVHADGLILLRPH